jgi:hypothetical protein
VVHGDTIEANMGDGGILIWDSSPTITDCVIRNNPGAGIHVGMGMVRRGKSNTVLADGRASGTRQPRLVVVEDCVLEGNSNGLTRTGLCGVRMRNCSISGNYNYGILNSNSDEYVDAILNWWGHPTGPDGVASGKGDAVSEYVYYYPWLGGSPYSIASSSRDDPTSWNNARKIVRDWCQPFYKVVYTDDMGVWVTMTDDPSVGPWMAPIEVWPVDMMHYSSDPAIAIEKTNPAGVHYPSRLHLVWSEHIHDSSQPGEIYYSYSNDAGFTWSYPENLSNTPETASEHPSIAVDGNDVVHVVWEEWATFSPEIIYVNNFVDGWTPPENISLTPLASVFPAIASNYEYCYGESFTRWPDDRVHVAWTEFEPQPMGGLTPWIAYRSYDFVYGWLPSLGAFPEDATVGTGGAMASIIAYPSLFEVGRAPAVVWHWPVNEEYPPVVPSEVYFNERTPGIWGIPTVVSASTVTPVDSAPSRLASLSVKPGTFSDSLWAVWEEWGCFLGRSEIYAAYSNDLGQTWNSHGNISNTPWDLSLHPGLAYQKGVCFYGMFDLCWTELPIFGKQDISGVFYLGTTCLCDSIYTSAPRLEVRSEEVVVKPALVCGPNPFRESVRFEIALPAENKATLTVFDLQGRLVRRFEAVTAAAGRAIFTWDGRDQKGQEVASGIYFARAHSGAVTGSVRVVLLR